MTTIPTWGDEISSTINNQAANLQLDNLRLRRLLTDAMLEKTTLEETLVRSKMGNELMTQASH